MNSVAVALGGNAETLANIAPGPRRTWSADARSFRLLRERLPDILERDVRERMKSYGDTPRPRGRDGHRCDYLCHARALPEYADSFAFPASAFAKDCCRRLRARRFPARSRIATTPPRGNCWSARAVLRGACKYDQTHAEHVRELSILLFDQLQPVHHLAGAVARAAGGGRAAARHGTHDQPSRPPQARRIPGD